MKTDLLKKLENKSFVIGVIGLGYVGLPLLYCFIEKGFRAIGFDIDKSKVDSLGKGKSYIKHIPAQRIGAAITSGKFNPTTDFAKVSECDAVLIAVPTPLNKNREPEMDYIVSTCEAMYPYIRKEQVIVLESSTYPGTTAEVVALPTPSAPPWLV